MCIFKWNKKMEIEKKTLIMEIQNLKENFLKTYDKFGLLLFENNYKNGKKIKRNKGINFENINNKYI